MLVFFDAELGEAIGIHVAFGKEAKIFGVVPDKWVRQFAHRIELEYDGNTHPIEAGFVRGLSKNGYGILGQKGFFDQVESITFEAKKAVFGIIP
ncbi:hypothetical protein HY417_01450 [Candidatus Kaiserbacteria bacterium]|nr:hypothetical protein [Candidatus Kaiserbacteria bacterium]